MKYITNSLRLLFISISLFAAANKVIAQSWNPSFTIGTGSGNYAFSYNQIPEQLVQLYPAAIPNTGLTYQWQQSQYSGTNGFTNIPGATGATYNIPAALSQTMYYRQQVNGPLGTIYSNIIKMSLVSVNWENYNYVREHDVLTTGITNWQTVDQMTIGLGQKLQTTSYLDGLGRPVEKVSKQTATPQTGSNLWGDMVQFNQYDNYGRESTKYLPYTTVNQSGKFKTGTATDQPAYYSSTYNETSAFSTISFDNSPLNRVKNIKEPGSVWAASAGKSASYDVNSLSDSVQLFGTDYVQGDAPLYIGAYAASTLYKLTYTDEYGKQVTEFTDKSGRLILKKVQIDDIPSSGHPGWICTYNVYDDFGLLRFQLQPNAVQYLDTNGWSFAGTNGQAVLNGYCFQYFYDDKGRTVWKKAPGAQGLNMLYDIRDRVVFMQDGNQAAMTPAQWTANLYDDLDRLTITTLYNTTETPANLQSDINNSVSLNTVSVSNAGSPVIDLVVDTRTAGANYTAQNTISFTSDAGGSFTSEDGAEFTAQIDPASVTASTTSTVAVFGSPISQTVLSSSACTIVKYLFYDNYSFNNVKSFSSNYTNTSAYSTSDPNVYPIATTARTLSMPTGSMVRVLGTNTFLASTEYYDEKGHHIQTLEDNIRNGVDITTNQYHFDGRLLSTCNSHSTPYTGYNNFITLTKYLFDNVGRVSSVQKQFGTNSLVSVANYDYDDIGRVKTKHLDPNYINQNTGTPDLESLNYTFNIHNQITGINKDYANKNPANYNKWGHFFGMYLGFDNKDNVFNTSRLNGQVTGILWNTQGDDAQRKYDYSYDNAGRLTKAIFNQYTPPSGGAGGGWSNSNMDFSVTGTSGQITYDLNGNLLTMLQKGIVPGTNTPLTIDDLRYVYNSYSNQLQSVTDQMTSTNLNGQFGDFKDGTNAAGTPDYVYDANGNLVVDLNKNVQSLNGGTNGISYNFLDKPEQINIAGKGLIKIVYDADGNKLQRTYTATGSTVTTVTTYINQFVYTETIAANTGATPPAGGWGAGTDTLRFINFEEGKVRLMQPVSQGNGFDALVENGNIAMPNNMMGVYDYFIMDYQKNVRMILTEETHQSSSTATMETSRAGIEDGVFGQLGSGNEVEVTRYATPAGWTGNTTASVSRLGNNAGHNLGPNTLQKVMAGDQVSASVLYYHQAAPTSTTNNLASNIVTNLLAALNSGTNTISKLIENNASNFTTQLNNTTPPYIGSVQPQNPNSSAPQAYLTILFFDERFNFVAAADGGAAQVQVAASVTGNGASLTLPNVKAPKNGYAYIYVSNQSDQDVYFDNLQAGITAGNIIEENHYYSYGLKIAGISSKALAPPLEGLGRLNNNLYNDKELFDDADLNWYNYGFRNYDPQIGRFIQIDPLADDYGSLTPYHYAANDPINNSDEDGLSVVSALGQVACWGGQSASMVSMMNTLKAIGNVVMLGVDILEGVGKVGAIVNDATTLSQINGQVKTQAAGVPKDNFVKFTKTAFDLDGGRLAYRDDDEGTDYLKNGRPSFKKEKNGKYRKQKDNADYIFTMLSILKKTHTKLATVAEKEGDQDQYDDPEEDLFIANNPALKKFGIKTGDEVSITYKKSENESKTVIARVSDSGPSEKYYKEGTLEMSPKTFRELGINFEMSIPTDKKGNVRKNSHNRDKKGTPQPYKKAKYIKAPNANLEVRKITK